MLVMKLIRQHMYVSRSPSAVSCSAAKALTTTHAFRSRLEAGHCELRLYEYSLQVAH